MIKRKGIFYTKTTLLVLVTIVELTSCNTIYQDDSGSQNSTIESYYIPDTSVHGDTINESAGNSNTTEVIVDVDEKIDNRDPDMQENIGSDYNTSNLAYKYAISASAGVRSCVFLLNNGSVKFFGDSYSGQKAANDWKNIVSVATLGAYVVGLTEDGKVVIAGSTNTSLHTDNWKDIICISAGEQYVAALDSSGIVHTSGHNGDGQCDFDGRDKIRLIATGWRHTVIVDDNDNVEVSGFGADKQNTQLKELKDKGKLKDIVKVDAGGGYEKKSGHTVILKADGSVEAVGNDSYGQCDVSSWESIVDIAAGDWHTVGLKSDGTVVVTGDYGVLNTKEEPLSKWKDIVAVSAGRGYTIGLKKDGTVIFAGYDHDNGTQLASDTSGIKIYPEWYVFNNEISN